MSMKPRKGKGNYKHKSGYTRPPRSKEWRENLGRAHKGKTISARQRSLVSMKLKGRVVSEEHRKKIGIALKGRVFSPEHRANISVAIGKKKGWVTSLNFRIRHSAEYRLWREAVFKRDDYKCIWCGAGGELNADHIRPFAYFPELRFAIDNGRTLCVPCHKLTDTFGYKAKIYG